MPRLRRTTIPRGAYTELRNLLVAPDRPFPPTFMLALATLIAPMIGRVRLLQNADGERPNILERAIDGEDGAGDFRQEPASPAPALGQAGDAIGQPSSHRGSNDVNVFVGFSLDPADDSLSIDIATGPVLAGQDLAALADASMPETPPPVHDFDIPPDDACFTAAEAARLLGVAKSTVTRRMGKNELIGFRVFKNALRIPRDQFRNGDVVDGVADILALFRIDSPDGKTLVDHKAAWTFLASTVYPGDAAPRPIDRLRAASPGRPTSRVLEELALARQSLDYGDHI